MTIWHGLDEIPDELNASVVTIGVFDGVHRGHQTLLTAAVDHASRLDILPVMVTFDPHPLAVIRPDKMPPLLSSVKDRAHIAWCKRIHKVLALRFDAHLAQLSPEEFFTDILLDRLGARVIVVGENFTFGHKAAGTTDTLRELGERYGVQVEVLPLLSEDGVPVSSSRIRAMVENSEIAEANAELTRYFGVEGIVERGAGRGGKELGFPTANLYFDEHQVLPADGVYAGYFTVLDSAPEPGDIERAVRYPAAISVGNNPTFGDPRRSVEAYVVDQDANLYGHRVKVEFVDFIRSMEKFSGIDELLSAIKRDVAVTRELTEPPQHCTCGRRDEDFL